MAKKVRVTIWRNPDQPETKLESALYALGIAENVEFVLGRKTLPFRIRLYWCQRRSRPYLERRRAVGEFLERRGWQRSEVFYNSYLTFENKESAEKFVQLLNAKGALVQRNSLFTCCYKDGQRFNMLSVASRNRVNQRRNYWRRCGDELIQGWHDYSDARNG